MWPKHEKESTDEQFNQVIITMKENIIVIRDPKTFCFNFDWPKDDGENS